MPGKRPILVYSAANRVAHSTDYHSNLSNESESWSRFNGVEIVNKSLSGTDVLNLQLQDQSSLEIPGEERLLINGNAPHRCLYCHSELTASRQLKSRVDYFHRGGENQATATLLVCAACGWWLYKYWYNVKHRSTGGKSSYNGSSNIYGVFEKYDVSSSDVPLHALRSYLGTHPTDMVLTNSVKFEQLIGDVFKDHWSDVEVVHVGKTADGGVDLMAVRNDVITCLVQVKRRTRLGGTEPVDTVRELNGVLLERGVPSGAVVTTAARFSKPAIKAAAGSAVSLARYNVQLFAFDDVVSLMRARRPRTGHVAAAVKAVTPFLQDLPWWSDLLGKTASEVKQEWEAWQSRFPVKKSRKKDSFGSAIDAAFESVWRQLAARNALSEEDEETEGSGAPSRD